MRTGERAIPVEIAVLPGWFPKKICCLLLVCEVWSACMAVDHTPYGWFSPSMSHPCDVPPIIVSNTPITIVSTPIVMTLETFHTNYM